MSDYIRREDTPAGDDGVHEHDSAGELHPVNPVEHSSTDLTPEEREKAKQEANERYEQGEAQRERTEKRTATHPEKARHEAQESGGTGE